MVCEQFGTESQRAQKISFFLDWVYGLTVISTAFEYEIIMNDDNGVIGW